MTPLELINELLILNYTPDTVDNDGNPVFLIEKYNQEYEVTFKFDNDPAWCDRPFIISVYDIGKRLTEEYYCGDIEMVIGYLKSVDRLPDLPTKGVFDEGAINESNHKNQ